MRKDMFILLSEKTDNEIVIKIAYTFYKNQKVEYIASLDDNIKNNPTSLNTQLQEFYRTAYLPSSIDTYLNQANEFVESFAEYISDTISEEYEKRIEGMNKAYEADLNSVIKNNVGGFWKPIWQGVISSIIFFIGSILIIFFIWIKDIPADKLISAFANGIKVTELDKEKPKE